MSLPQIAPGLALLERPLIDVRAPVEFAQGALPGAVNLPLMDDDERQAVGIRYKEAGQAAAIELGTQLVDGALKRRRVAAWQAFAERHPQALIYCFRGGLRSQIAQQWLQETGITLPRIQGGWKAMRQCLSAEITSAATRPTLVVAGLTGSAKTELIQRLDTGVDLEGHARHKGSAFGRHPLQGPSQIDFEHSLGVALSRMPLGCVVEDESRMIGRLDIPLSFWRTMEAAPRIRVEMPLDWRLEQIRKDYIETLWQTYRGHYGEWLGWALMRKQLSSALKRVRKRLGSARFQRLQRLQALAFREHQRGNTQAHEAWLAPLMLEYYDPMYRYQLEQSPHEALHVGDWESCLAFARDWSASLTR